MTTAEKLYQCRYCRNVYTREAAAIEWEFICPYHPGERLKLRAKLKTR
jgi:hypothetical protein